MWAKSANRRQVIFTTWSQRRKDVFSFQIHDHISNFWQVRGTLLSLSTVARTGGFSLVYLMGRYLSWRDVSLVCSIFPVITFIAICFVNHNSIENPFIRHLNTFDHSHSQIPESPNWLLSKQRPNDAQKSLQWLRGWVQPAAVQQEFEKLQTHIELVNACSSCAQLRTPCPHPAATICDKLKELKQKRNLNPFILVMSLNVLLEFSGAICLRPYIIQVIKAHGIPMDAHSAAMILGLTSIAGGLTFLVCVKLCGKRRLYLNSTAIVVISCIGLGETPNQKRSFFLDFFFQIFFLKFHLC